MPKPGKSSHRGCAPLIKSLHKNRPDLPPAEIARRVGCSVENVSEVLSRYLGKTSIQTLRDFQQSKADVYDTLQHKLLESLTPDKLRKSSALQSTTAAAILEDKARLVRGQATGINVTALLDVAQLLRDARSTPPPIDRKV